MFSVRAVYVLGPLQIVIVGLGADMPSAQRQTRLAALKSLNLTFFVITEPRLLHTLNSVLTDDAYVNSYVTFVAPRVAGQVARVLVEDNDRVKKGDVLVELDPEPYRVHVAIKQAAVDSAQVDLILAEASVRGLVAQTRSLRFKLIRAIEDVDNQIAIIRARVATWEQSKATLVLAQAELDRAEHLIANKVVSAEEYDKKRLALDVAKAQVKQALENIYQARVALGLPGEPPEGTSLADVPANLDQSFSSVRQALADLTQGAAKLGIVASSYNLTPKQVIDEFYSRYPGGDIDRIFADIIRNAPDLKRAEASLLQAQRDLDQAKLDLRYCTIVAEIDGVVTGRNVNPGNNVQVGQSLGFWEQWNVIQRSALRSIVPNTPRRARARCCLLAVLLVRCQNRCAESERYGLPSSQASPTGRELQELFTPNLFELGFAGQNTRQPIPRLASPDSAGRHGRLHCCPIAERRVWGRSGGL